MQPHINNILKSLKKKIKPRKTLYLQKEILTPEEKSRLIKYLEKHTRNDFGKNKNYF